MNIDLTKTEIDSLLRVLGNTSSDPGALKAVFIDDLHSINRYIVAENKLRKAINIEVMRRWNKENLKTDDGAY